MIIQYGFISNNDLNCINEKKNTLIRILLHFVPVHKYCISFFSLFFSWYGVRVKKFYPCFKIFKIFWQAQEKERLRRFWIK